MSTSPVSMITRPVPLTVPDNFTELSLSNEARSLFIDLVMEFNAPAPEQAYDSTHASEVSRVCTNDNPPASPSFFPRKTRRKQKSLSLRFMGQKNAAHAWGIQTTKDGAVQVILVTCLLLGLIFAAPLVHVLMLTPQLAENAHKLEEIKKFQNSANADAAEAQALLRRVRRAQKLSGQFATHLLLSTQHDTLLQSYLAALERFGITVNMFDVRRDNDASPELPNAAIRVQIVTLELQGQFDIYRDIRNIFMAEARHVTVLEEHVASIAQTQDVHVKSRLMLAARERKESL